MAPSATRTGEETTTLRLGVCSLWKEQGGFEVWDSGGGMGR